MSSVRQSYPDWSCFGFPACEPVGNVGNEGKQRTHMLFLFIASAVIVSAWLPAGANFCARSKTSRIAASVSPTHLDRSAGPFTISMWAPHSPATARASEQGLARES